jgi:hypothetical protein
MSVEQKTAKDKLEEPTVDAISDQNYLSDPIWSEKMILHLWWGIKWSEEVARK